MAMERPPMPPDVQAQLAGGGGQPPFSSVGGMMAQKQGAGNPLKSAVDMTSKLWENVVRGNPKIGPYVQRAMAILNAGVEAASGAKTEGGNQSENGGAVPQPQPAGNVPG
jgi:hypothetical protein